MKKSSTPTKWHKLDNTANIFPVVASRRMANVFRLTAVLRDEVEPALLQTALEETLPYFAAFNVRLR
ncbi:MAG: MFS transporter, partial [Ruthenibacterium sp.]